MKKNVFMILFLIFLNNLSAEILLPKDCYKLVELDQAKAQAIKLKKPIAFLAMQPEFFEEDEEHQDPFSKHPAGATVYAIQALGERVVLVLVDAEREQLIYPKLLSQGLFQDSTGSFIPPKVVIVDAAMTKIIDVVEMAQNVTERQHKFALAIQKIESSMDDLSPVNSVAVKKTLEVPPEIARKWALWEWGILIGLALFVVFAVIRQVLSGPEETFRRPPNQENRENEQNGQ